MITLYVVPATKKNSSQMVMNPKTHRWFPVPSKAYKKFESECLKQIKNIIDRPIKISNPVNICCTFYMPTKRAVDGLNLCEAVDDVLVKAGILEDDNRDIVAGHDGSRVYLDKDNPRIEISITNVGEYEQWKTHDRE